MITVLLSTPIVAFVPTIQLVLGPAAKRKNNYQQLLLRTCSVVVELRQSNAGVGYQLSVAVGSVGAVGQIHF